MENIVIVEKINFFVNRQNPTEISYDDTSYWEPMSLDSYIFQLPQPSENQILYKLKEDETVLLYGKIVNL